MRASRRLILLVLFGLILNPSPALWTAQAAGIRVGAATADVTPRELPVRLAGMFLVRYGEKIHSPLKARALALEDDRIRIVIAVVDSVGIPRWILDDAKRQVSKKTGIPMEHMLISSTHTHTAPPVRTSHGTDPDLEYAKVLTSGIVTAIERATRNLTPARVGSAVVDAGKFAGVRRWILRPDRMREDPFGNLTIRASMHTARNLEDVTGPSGPMDPDLSMISFQTTDGKPLALLANFANHYAGAPRVDDQVAVSADYFGLFADKVEERLAGSQTKNNPVPFVAMMSQGTSGDIGTRSYWDKTERPGFEEYTQGIVDLALGAYDGIEYEENLTLGIAQADLLIPFRTPDKQRLEWAQRVFGDLESGRVPQNQEEVYARHALYLDRIREASLLLQAIRIGDIGITGIPNEVYGLTGLRLKELSPLKTTINIELANGSEGYLPPAEQHVLGGYNTWPALSSCLETDAESRVAETVLQLLEEVASKPRRTDISWRGPAVDAVAQARPRAYFPMDEFAGPRAIDSHAGRHGIYEQGVIFYLPGPRFSTFSNSSRGNRAAHFAGGRMRAPAVDRPDNYSVSLWFWNGMLSSVRSVTGYLFSFDRDRALGPRGDHLGIGGNEGNQGRLIFHHGRDHGGAAGGLTEIERWKWHHAVIVREGTSVRVYLNGKSNPEIAVESALPPASLSEFFVGGRSDNRLNFEGRIDEVAIFDRALSADEISALYRAATIDGHQLAVFRDNQQGDF